MPPMGEALSPSKKSQPFPENNRETGEGLPKGPPPLVVCFD